MTGPKPEIIRTNSGQYVVRNGRANGRNINPYGTWRRERAECELQRRLAANG